MSRGKQQQERRDLKRFAYKIKTKDLPKPIFVESEDQGGKFVENAEPQYNLSGNLIGVEPKETVWQGKTIKSVNVTLVDNTAGEIYFITVPYSNLGRGLMNSLLALKSFDNVEIGLYQTKPKADGGKTYPAVSLRQAGEIVRWRYDQKDLPPPDEIVFKGEKMRDFTKVETFFADQLKELNKVVKSTPQAQTKETVAAAVGAPESDKGDLDVPF